MNILAFILGRLIAEREGADEQTATRVGLIGALLPMPLGLLVAATAGRTVNATSTGTTPGPETKPKVETPDDALPAIGAAFAAFSSDARARDKDGGDEEIVDKARHIVNELWRAHEEALVAAEKKELANRKPQAS